MSVKSTSNSRIGLSNRDNPLQRGRGDSSKWIEEEKNRSLSRRGSSNSVEYKLESMTKLSAGGMSTAFSHHQSSTYGHYHKTGKDPKNQALKEEIELVRSKNKALYTVNKEKFPDFLKRLDDMRSTVQMNITYSFTSRLRDIWSSYIKDQKQRKAIVDDRALMDELKPIEESFVNFLSSRTDLLVNEQTLKNIKEIKKEFQQETRDNAAPSLDDPLYKQESECRAAHQEYSKLEHE